MPHFSSSIRRNSYSPSTSLNTPSHHAQPSRSPISSDHKPSPTQSHSVSTTNEVPQNGLYNAWQRIKSGAPKIGNKLFRNRFFYIVTLGPLRRKGPYWLQWEADRLRKQYRALFEETRDELLNATGTDVKLFIKVKHELLSLEKNNSDYEILDPLDWSLNPKQVKAAGKRLYQGIQKLADKHRIKMSESRLLPQVFFDSRWFYLYKLRYFLTLGALRSHSKNGKIAMQMIAQSEENYNKIMNLADATHQIKDSDMRMKAKEESFAVLINVFSKKKERFQIRFSRSPKHIHEAWQRVIAPLLEFAEKYQITLDRDLLSLKRL